jgi:hypothetical protein
VVGIGRAPGQRHEGDVVAIVAEPLLLLLGRDLVAVELRQAGRERVAPARDDRGLVAFGDRMRLVVDALQLDEAERRLRGCGMRLPGEQRSGEAAAGQQGAGAEPALEQVAPRDAGGDDVADDGSRRGGGWAMVSRTGTSVASPIAVQQPSLEV